MNNMTTDERYKGLLLAMCKYHQNLKDDAEYLREKINDPDCREQAKSSITQRANLISDQRKAILWLLFRRKPDLEQFFGTHEPEIIATHPFYEEDADLAHVETVPSRKLGLKKRDADGRPFNKVMNWRLRGLNL